MAELKALKDYALVKGELYSKVDTGRDLVNMCRAIGGLKKIEGST